ncbi:putative mitochondrial protein AtMg00310 [Nicotiana tabacum]|uniref:Mitochondrial protein AtMg00310 n=1 Tax=Nicotiana tabacum TaxID=4097 RepID=A0AC58UBD6_TOBAC
MKPPKTIFKQIESYFAKYFWGTTDGKQIYHWCSWTNMCYLKEEGGMGFRSMLEISESFSIKRSWRFRTCKSLWADFLKTKYCSRLSPCEKKWSAGLSHSWKKLLQVREKAKANILWNVNNGASSLWWDNWTGIGALANKVIGEKS